MEGRASEEKTIHFSFPSASRLLQFQKEAAFFEIYYHLINIRIYILLDPLILSPSMNCFISICVYRENCIEKVLEKEGQGLVEEHAVITLKLQACLNANRDTSPTQPPTCKLKYEHSEYLSQNTALHTICSCIHILLVTSGTCTHTHTTLKETILLPLYIG